jgi:hypothetical protein
VVCSCSRRIGIKPLGCSRANEQVIISQKTSDSILQWCLYAHTQHMKNPRLNLGSASTQSPSPPSGRRHSLTHTYSLSLPCSVARSSNAPKPKPYQSGGVEREALQRKLAEKSAEEIDFPRVDWGWRGGSLQIQCNWRGVAALQQGS